MTEKDDVTTRQVIKLLRLLYVAGRERTETVNDRNEGLCASEPGGFSNDQLMAMAVAYDVAIDLVRGVFQYEGPDAEALWSQMNPIIDPTVETMQHVLEFYDQYKDIRFYRRRVRREKNEAKREARPVGLSLVDAHTDHSV